MAKKEAKIIEARIHEHTCPKCGGTFACVSVGCEGKKGRDCVPCLMLKMERLSGGLAYFLDGRHTQGGHVDRATPAELEHIKKVEVMAGKEPMVRPPVYDSELWEIIDCVASREAHADLNSGYYRRVIREIVIEYIEKVERK